MKHGPTVTMTVEERFKPHLQTVLMHFVSLLQNSDLSVRRTEPAPGSRTGPPGARARADGAVTVTAWQ
jgi:hypothetical protein